MAVIWQAQTRETRFEALPLGTPAPFSHYKAVCVVDESNLNEIFRILNLWDEPEKVTLCPGVDGMASLSVGDIIQQDGGAMFQVAPVDFNPIKFDYTK
jgi:hypothetical protein